MLRWMITLISVLTLVSLSACADKLEMEFESINEDEAGDDDDNDDNDAPDDPSILIEVARLIVPSEGLPPAVILRQANNNLDVVSHNGRVYLAFRTAPSHFASSKVTIYVVSSEDETSWDFETAFELGTDLREPRFLSWSGRLFLYFALLGTSPINFEPGEFMVSEYLGPGNWSPEQSCYEPGFIPWRTKVIDGVPYMLAYVGGEGIYDLDAEPIRVHWLTTKDGYDWEPVIPDQPVVLEGGGSETDFVFTEDGALIAVSRNEMGDESGYGMNICRAEPESLGQWDCVNDPKKYDSPLMFRHGDGIYLIGRRNLSETGNYDLGYKDMSPTVRHLLYELDYWIHPKRTSLWKIDPETLEVEFLVDFPSRGDTCFPGIVHLSGNRFAVYNYTSPLNGPDAVWVVGQVGPTSIVRTELEFIP